MQKKLIALAVAAVASGAAFADTNVTVYGTVDTSLESVKASGGTAPNTDTLSRGRLSSNSSNVGFKGSEDLGNGLKAVFQIETGIASDSGGFQGDTKNAVNSPTTKGRDTYIGLAGGFGTVLAGNLTHPARTLGLLVDNNPGGSSIAFTSLQGQFSGGGATAAGVTVNTVRTGADDRAANAIAYVSPTMSGFTGYLVYVAGENRSAPGIATPSVDGKMYQVAATYGIGGLVVGYGHHETKNYLNTTLGVGASTLDSAKAVVDRVVAKYNFGQGTTIAALYDTTKLKSPVDSKRRVWTVTANQAFGASNVYAQYSNAGDTTGGALANSNTGAKQVTLGYTYSLSKRSMVRAYYTKITNESAAAYDFLNNGVTPAAGADPVGYGIGLRHSF